MISMLDANPTAPRDCRGPLVTRWMPELAVVAALSTLVTLAAPAPPATAAVRARRSSAGTVWLCRPGQAHDPCAASRVTTSVNATGGTTSGPPTARLSQADKVDCFYVYPTVSREHRTNADLTVQPAEVDAAVAQASQFSRVCNVWAPMYHQETVRALRSGGFFRPAPIATAYESVLSAWRDYLAHDNHGHRVVFIGHSQGAAMLIKLLRAEIDPSPTRRGLLLSAVILGGNVQVATGRDVGGSFRHVPTCTSAGQTGCVIAYSTFGQQPPTASLFGRPGQGVSLQSEQTAVTGQQVACVNPATLSSAPGTLLPLYPTATVPVRGVIVTTPWTSFSGLYTAQCEQVGGATWLQVTATPGSDDPRPEVSATQGPTWGYHANDVNLALGNLVADVATQEAAAAS